MARTSSHPQTRLIREAMDHGEGVLRLVPVWVPRRFGLAGQRLKLHPDDYFALGTARGSIKERWFASMIPAQNGPLAPADEGMSHVLPADDDLSRTFTLKSVQDLLGAELVGRDLMRRFGGWPMYSKFFDYETPLFHHLHLTEDKARKVGRKGKPEAYYFPAQLNNHAGQFPATYFGFDPDVSKAEVRARLAAYTSGDNRITELSRAYRIQLGTGWYTPPGVVHAPGSVLTYEPQWNSDVNSVYENVAAGEVYPYDFLVENCPRAKQRDLDYVMSLMDWEKNVDPHYRDTYFRPGVVRPGGDDRYSERWVVYGNDFVGATELTILPGCTVTVRDPVAYGCIVVQGHGSFGVHQCEAATLLRYGGRSADEFFVAQPSAAAGITISNRSLAEPLVILKHFAPNHPGMPR